MDWYLLQTKPNSQTLAQKHLARQGFEVFLPLLIKQARRGSKFVNSLKPLFPGYLFLGSNLEEISWKSINATRGISKAVTLDGQYRTVGTEIIEGIKRRCDQDNILQSMDHLEAGDLVKIERGPLADFICSVDKIEDNRRVWVLIEILHQKTRTEVPLGHLLKIS